MHGIFSLLGAQAVPHERRRTTEQAVVATVREWVEREVYPVASEYEHADEFPTPLVEDMKELGLFGVTIPRSTAGSASTCSPTR